MPLFSACHFLKIRRGCRKWRSFIHNQHIGQTSLQPDAHDRIFHSNKNFPNLSGRWKPPAKTGSCGARVAQCEFLFACTGECPIHRFAKTPAGDAHLSYLCAGLEKFSTTPPKKGRHGRGFNSIFTDTTSWSAIALSKIYASGKRGADREANLGRGLDRWVRLATMRALRCACLSALKRMNAFGERRNVQ